MKKSCKVLCLMLVVFMLSGCVKADIDMSINKDKSMKLSITSALAESLLQQYGTDSIMDEDTKQEAEKQGFKIEDYSDGSMKGFTFSKEFKNIDDISSEKKTNFDLDKLMNEADAKIFTIKKGFFKNTYSVVMENDTSEEIENQMDFGDSTNSLDYTNDLDYNDAQDTLDDSYTQDNSIDLSNDIDMSALTSSMDMKFSVTLPYKAIKSNATSTENDGKKLVWNLMDQSIQNIELEFELYNMNNIYLTAGIAGVIILIIIIVIVSKKRKHKKTEGTPEPVVNKTVENTNSNVTPAVSTTNGQPNVSSNTMETPVTQINQGSQVMNNVAAPQEKQAPGVASVQDDLNKVENTVSNNVETTVAQEVPASPINQPAPMNATPQEQSAPEVTPTENNMNKTENIIVNNQNIQESSAVNTVDANIFNSTPNSENK